MKVALDFDGVLCDVHTLALALMNHEFRSDFVLDDWKDWFWAVEAFGHDAFWSTWDLIAQQDLRLALPPFPHAIGAIEEMRHREGFEVDVVTGNRERGAASIRKWLDANGLGDLKLVHQEPGDWTWKGELDYDVFVEDSPPFFEKIPQYPRPDERLWIVFDRPWNRGIQDNGGNVRRAYGWIDVLRLIVRWEAGKVKRHAEP